MKKLLLIVGIFSLISCTKEKYPEVCLGGCGTHYEIQTPGAYLGSDGYYRVPFNGLTYFQIKGNLTEIDENYVINGIPLIEANFDSDYWVVFDTLRFQTPMYSYLGWFNDNTLNTPIPFGSYVYTINDLIDLHPPTNIVGYQIPKHFCAECPYAKTILGTHSKYNYTPTLNIFYDIEMIGDTVNVFIESVFNTEGGIVYHGNRTPSPKEVINDHLKIIII